MNSLLVLYIRILPYTITIRIAQYNGTVKRFYDSNYILLKEQDKGMWKVHELCQPNYIMIKKLKLQMFITGPIGGVEIEIY